jgi:hypothetical protein
MIMDRSYVFIGYGVMIFSIFISSLLCIAGCMHYGGVWFWYALLVMVPWFIGLFGLFGVVRIFWDIGNRLASIAIMLIDMGMVQCIIRLVNKPMSAAARGIMFGKASDGISIFFQVSMLFSIIIIGYLMFKIAGLCVRGVRFMLGEPVS